MMMKKKEVNLLAKRIYTDLNAFIGRVICMDKSGDDVNWFDFHHHINHDRYEKNKYIYIFI